VADAGHHAQGSWTASDPYEAYVGRWSRLVAREFVVWLGLPPGLRWLDIGCGTGVITKTILDLTAPAEVLAVDASEAFIAAARTRLRDPRARFQVGDARALPVRDTEVDVATSGLALNFVPDHTRAVAEMQRAVRPGGTIALYVWDYAGEMQMIRHFWNAATALDAGAQSLDEGQRFPICRPERLLTLFKDRGITRTECIMVDIPTVFTDFNDFWSPFLGGEGPAPSYLRTLAEQRQTTLRQRVRAALPVADDGSIALTARAFAIRGIR
jgi:trans-aconitate methyltransferase